MNEQADAHPAYFDIELATARAEAVMARASAVMRMLLDGPNSRNSHFAQAVQTILDGEVPKLRASMDELADAVLNHYPDPSQRPVSEANQRRTAELEQLTARYEVHMTTHVSAKESFTTQSVVFTMLAYAIGTAQAIQELHAETLGREPDDVTSQAYRQAIIEIHQEIPGRREAVAKLVDDECYRNSRIRAMHQQATRAIERSEALLPELSS